MALNFADVASKKMDEVERPPLPPVGTYRFSITKLPETAKSNDEVWEILTFNVRAVEALDDVDMSDYKGEVTNILQQVKFMFNTQDEVEFEKSLFRLRQFLEQHVQCADADMTIAQALNASVNQQFLGTIAWRQDKNDPENFFANISRTAPLE
jgi:ribosomal protein S10